MKDISAEDFSNICGTNNINNCRINKYIFCKFFEKNYQLLLG